jgi:hypothetical protein
MSNTITLKQAVDLTTRYRTAKSELLKEEYADKNIMPVCETFDKEAINKLLAHPGCVRLRVYLGMKEDQDICTILVGVDAEDKDILPAIENTGEAGDDEPVIVEDGIRCPPICPPPSPLNA